jgi:hypothetical protein
MDFRQAKLDWVDILQPWIIYSYVDWRKLATSDESENIEGSHGRITSPVYARYRIITLEWVCDRIPGWEEARVNHLQSLFSLQWDVSGLQARELYVKDNFDNERKLKVKIKEPIEFIEWDDNMNWSYWRWRTVLESLDTPIFKSFWEIVIDAKEGNYWGLTMEFILENSWDEWDEIIEIKTGSIEIWIRFEIFVKWEIHSPLVIKNITDNSFFGLDITAINWDKIVIDSEKFIATKNWENIIWFRTEWSKWQLAKWTTFYNISDKDWNIFDKDFNVKIYYSNVLL